MQQPGQLDRVRAAGAEQIGAAVPGTATGDEPPGLAGCGRATEGGAPAGPGAALCGRYATLRY
ncbi:hypothetical protein GCM10010168_16330 [Actinoplanes ianthinogenes]|uniref:Uncharacterized protein n=1 Tax=Actinoplanes ianthinogenes TaxID=122358 RepID=A0ABN6CGW7_9ACTN|nr:hypothetical protein Aiant_54770 [Actinoplanes ianthinogenes]GGR00180.1 hypothetical protein GCM10010168_16330 [Actinoplanes ianthinogenes]